MNNIDPTNIANALGDPSTKEMIYREFHNHLAIIEAEVELHASMWDYPVGLSGEDVVFGAKKKKTSKYNIILTIYASKAHKDLGLLPDDESGGIMPISSYYQDEWSNIEGWSDVQNSAGCKCPICTIKARKMEQWTDIDFGVGAAAIDFIREWQNNPKLDRKEYKTVIEKGVKKSMNIMDAVKKLYEQGKTPDEIREIVKKAYEAKENQDLSKSIFSSPDGWELWKMNEGIDNPVKDFFEKAKCVNASTDVLTFVPDLIKAKK